MSSWKYSYIAAGNKGTALLKEIYCAAKYKVINKQFTNDLIQSTRYEGNLLTPAI